MNETELNNLVAEVEKEYVGKDYDTWSTPYDIGKAIVDRLNAAFEITDHELEFFFDSGRHSKNLIEVWYGNRAKAASYLKLANIKVYKSKGQKHSDRFLGGTYCDWSVKSVTVEYCVLHGEIVEVEDFMKKTVEMIADNKEEKHKEAIAAQQIYKYMLSSGLAKDRDAAIRICKTIEKLY